MSTSELPQWKQGRGRLGALDPLLGCWVAEADSPMGPVTCTRTFTRVLGDKYVRVEVRWAFADRVYEEWAVYGVDEAGSLGFWSFTSDGKRSEGRLVEAPDLDPRAIAFEAQMPAGTARMAYWPGEGGSVHWVVESRTKKGWNRFTEHCYRRS